jgi:hypothetical protein
MRVRGVFGLVSGVALVAVAACGDSNGPARGPVALLTNAAYVEYDTSDYAAEASQLQFTLEYLGFTVSPVGAIDSASLAIILRASAVFVVPEQETGALAPVLSEGAKFEMRRFVDSSGGTLIVHGDRDSRGFALLDSLFNYAIGAGAGSGTGRYPMNAAAAAGTSFASGPSFLWEADATNSMDSTSLPTGAKTIYHYPGGGVAVAVIPQGRGFVILLAYDWYNAAPHGVQDGGWLQTLRGAVRY